MGFSKPPVERWVKFGDGDKQERRVTGVLMDIEVAPDRGNGFGPQYIYSVLQADGTVARFGGKKSFDKAIKAKHVGEIIQLQWLGRETSKNGYQYDNIEFEVFSPSSDEERDQFKALYPAWGTVQMAVKPDLAAPVAVEFAPVGTDDDDLPF